MFLDRNDAGIKLSTELERFVQENPIILTIPRGGIIVALETIKKFNFDWDLIIPRKIGLPDNKEIAIGAVALDGSYLINERYAAMLDISEEYIEKEVLEQTLEIKRRLEQYKGNTAIPELKDRTVIIIDDGIATGYTIQAAIKSVKKHEAKRIILAVPVAPMDTISQLKELADEVICLNTPSEFYGVSEYYKDFKQLTDEEVIEILKQLRKVQHS